MSQLKDVLKRAVGPAELKRVMNLRAADSDTDTANFSGHLSSADDTVQKALDTLDDIGSFTGELTSTDEGALAAPTLTLYRNSASPAANDVIGNILFKGRNDNSQDVTYAEVDVRINDETDTTEDSYIRLKTIADGTLSDRLALGEGLFFWGITGGQPAANYINASGYEIDGDDITTSGAVPGALIAIVEDQKTSGTDGGTFTSGADRTRDLNTIVYNRNTTVSLNNSGAGPGLVLPAGDWEIEWSAPAKQVNEHQSFLYNTSDSTEIKRGTSEKTIGASGDGNRSFGSARVSIAGSKTYEIRHRCNTTRSTDGFGDAGSFGTEVYTRVVVRKG